MTTFKNITFDAKKLEVSLNDNKTFTLYDCKITRFPDSNPTLFFTKPGKPHYLTHVSAHIYKGKFIVNIVHAGTLVKNFSLSISKEEAKEFKNYCKTLPEYDWK